ncbi:hypothetical protein C1752_04527 [Acaryochloris thomasi RCC1774]|uniref:CENP-V/GFA domain-containing protein n=1 Tax=Acaryochloris thomasi RCC1774 TaxID=1764569 RepID=A0A2W1JK19_9CYAN|nr:GFA family protein [Acaryochloris thomasi]PZD71825.1 hypothetical protein C1752_04527 [Acaryochloris thomasi RCC1774]
MTAPYTGRCQCGQVRYEIRAEPLTVYACHCRECQRQSASAFGMSMPVPRAAVILLQGTPKQWSRTSDSGREVVCFFCGECGTRLFHNPTRNPQITNIKPGTLDDTRELRAVGNLWIRSAQPWIHCSEETLNYQGQPTPEEYSQLLDKFSLQMPVREE